MLCLCTCWAKCELRALLRSQLYRRIVRRPEDEIGHRHASLCALTLAQLITVGVHRVVIALKVLM